jgi:2-polyprenyl-3-methyl-5-hydroxy-6-metoxy-1,4-benzoquinol methylase
VTRRLLARFLQELDTMVDDLRPSSLLDVGCGEGIVTERLATRTGVTTVGVDSGDEALQAHWAERERGLLTFASASAYDLPFDAGSFDCVSALEVLEHLERPRDALAEMVRVAARTILVSVPREPAWRIAHVLAGRDLGSLGNTPGHVNHWSARTFTGLVSEYGAVRRVARPFPWTIVALDV